MQAPIASSQHSVSGDQFQKPHPKSIAPLPIDQWNNDRLISLHLSRIPEPAVKVDRAVQLCRLVVVNNRIRQLELMAARIAPRESIEINTELAGARVKRKILVWFAFPINDLPTELLSRIFRFVLWDSVDMIPTASHRPHLIITWVCRRWRAVAIGDQILWSSIWVKDVPPHPCSMTWFERAGTAPITIHIIDEVPDPAPSAWTQDVVGNLLDVLLVKVSQFRHVTVSLRSLAAIYVVMEKFAAAGNAAQLELFDVRLINLENISMIYHARTDYPEVRKSYPLCGGATPKLRRLGIHGFHVDWDKSTLSNLTTIDMRGIAPQYAPSMDRWQDILRECPMLHMLYIHAFEPSYSESCQGQRHVSLLYLRDLMIGSCSLAGAKHIVSLIRAPHLLSLQIMHMLSEDFSPLLRLLTGRYRELQMLAMFAVEVTFSKANQRILVKWFESMPQLRMARFMYLREYIMWTLLVDPQDFLDHRGDAEPRQRQILCPKLEIIEHLLLDIESIDAFSCARSQIGAPVHMVYIGNIM